jgi:hypothetical protein
MLKIFLTLGVVISSSLSLNGIAAAEVSCNEECPSGQSLVSFVDGERVSCKCLESAVMEPTVPDENQGLGEETSSQ